MEANELADRISDYLLTRITPWPDEDLVREVVALTVGLMVGEARDYTLEVMNGAT